MEKTILYWIWMQQVFDCGSPKPVQLWRKFSSVRSFFEQAPGLLEDSSVFSKAESRRAGNVTLEDCQRIFEQAQKLKMKLLTPDDTEYPECLLQIAAPPAVLYYQGTLPPVDDVPTVAIVGSRVACPNAMTATRLISRQLAEAGAVIVSGGAVGIDSAAHAGALEAGGKTISLLASSLDLPYLKSNEKMRRTIAEQGMLCSEYPPGTPARKWHFGIRNRLISGLSCGVLVSEASLKSGSMMTAHHAVEQSRDVFTLLVDSWRDNAEGVLRLLWDGAKPVSCAADILTEFKSRFPACEVPERKPLSQLMAEVSPVTNKEGLKDYCPPSEIVLPEALKTPEPFTAPVLPQELSPAAQKVYEVLGREPMTAESIHTRTGLLIQEIFQAVTELEICGRIQSFSGRRYAKKS